GANGINLSGATSGFITTTGGALSGSTGTAFSISSGTCSVTYAGSITGVSGQRSVNITGMTGGTVTLSGAVTENAGGTGISLTTNTGATINFTGNITANLNSANTPFTATGGGTVSATGTNSNISSVSGTALNVANTTIGAGNLNFRSISSGNATAAADPVNGIILNNTGSSGTVIVAGDGGVANNASGGTIQSCTGVGVLLTSCRGPSLGYMDIKNGQAEGIHGTTVSGLTLTRCNISTNGNLLFGGGALGQGEANIELFELSGTVNFTNTLIERGFENNIIVGNSGTTNLNMTWDGVTMQNWGAPTPNQGQGLKLDLRGSTVTTFTTQNSTLSNSYGSHFDVRAMQASNLTINVRNNTITQTVVGVSGGANIAISALGDSSIPAPFTGLLTYDISNNNIQGSSGTAIAVALSPGYLLSPNPHVQGNGDAQGKIINNTIGTAATANSGSAQGSGIAADSRGGTGSVHTVQIENNRIFQYNNYGISLTVGETNSDSRFNVTVRRNTISNPGNSGFLNMHGIHLNSGTTGTSADDVWIDLGTGAGNSNSITGSGANGGTDFRLRQRQLTTVLMPNYTGANNADASVVTYVQGLNGGTPTGAAVNNVAGGGGGFTNTVPAGSAVPLPP
ncbi:MAG TPA: hypothetical protein VEK08_08105, partial [Planctomycetota bacterium]|nr:hypothetical protein [Planctomycetota bacterium]